MESNQTIWVVYFWSNGSYCISFNNNNKCRFKDWRFSMSYPSQNLFALTVNNPIPSKHLIQIIKTQFALRRTISNLYFASNPSFRHTLSLQKLGADEVSPEIRVYRRTCTLLILFTKLRLGEDKKKMWSERGEIRGFGNACPISRLQIDAVQVSEAIKFNRQLILTISQESTQFLIWSPTVVLIWSPTTLRERIIEDWKLMWREPYDYWLVKKSGVKQWVKEMMILGMKI